MILSKLDLRMQRVLSSRDEACPRGTGNGQEEGVVILPVVLGYAKMQWLNAESISYFIKFLFSEASHFLKRLILALKSSFLTLK